MIFTLVKNELIKTFSKAKTWIVFALFVAFIVGLSFVNYKQSENIKEYTSPQYMIEYLKDRKDENNKEIERLKDSSDEHDKEYSAQLASNNKELDEKIAKYENILNCNEEQWVYELKLEKEEIESYINSKDIAEAEKEFEKERLNEINYFLDNNKKPVKDWEFDGVNVSSSILEILGTVILSVGIAVFMSDMVAGEATPPTFKFLLVQPISRSKVIISKFIATVITVVGLIGSAELAVFGIISALAGTKGGEMPLKIGLKYAWDYNNLNDLGLPVLKEVSGSGVISTRGTALLQGFLLQILFIIACCAFIFLISAIFNSTIITMVISVIVPVAITISCELSKEVAKIAHLLFINYGSTVSVIRGDIALVYQNPNLTLQNGLIVMCLTIVISYVLAHFVFCKKDMLV